MADYTGEHYWEADSPPFRSRCWPQYILPIGTVDRDLAKVGFKNVWAREGAIRALNRKLLKSNGHYKMLDHKGRFAADEQAIKEVDMLLREWYSTAPGDIPRVSLDLARSGRDAVRSGCLRGDIPLEMIPDGNVDAG